MGAAGWAGAQTPNLADNPQERPTQEPLIRAKSSLVLVPVFVYTHDGLERAFTPGEGRCETDEGLRLKALSAEEPFIPMSCEERGRVVEDLTLDDFRLFQDGVQQKIETMTKERWPLYVRDNRTWHSEFSDTPMASWSSTDLGHPFRAFQGVESFLPWAPRGSYLLGYAPSFSEKGCHRIRVEVRRSRVRIFARDEYCSEQTPSDLLSGTKTGEKLEHEMTQSGQGKIPLFVQAGAFRGEGSQQLADVVLEFPWDQLKHYWGDETARLNASIGVSGAVYARDGKLVTRFSDLLWPSYWPTILEGWPAVLEAHGWDPAASPYYDYIIQKWLSAWDPVLLPTRYETQFELEPGEYQLRVILSDGRDVGRATVPLNIENYDSNSFALGSIFLCKRFRDAHVAAVEAAAANFTPQYVPLVSKGIRVTPAGDTNFRPGEPLIPYFEIYTPQGTVAPAGRIQAHLRIVDAKTGAVVKDFPPVDAATYMQPGSATIPIAREIPIATLPKGEYRLEVQAADSAGRSTPWRAASFTVD